MDWESFVEMIKAEGRRMELGGIPNVLALAHRQLQQAQPYRVRTRLLFSVGAKILPACFATCCF